MNKQSRALILATAAGLAIQMSALAGAELKHRYSFNETDGTVAADSVGGEKWNAAIKGKGAKWEKGQVVLAGGASGTDSPYVDLPNKIVSPLTSLTLETSVTWKDTSEEYWQRIFDIGSSEEGENQSGKGKSYMMLTAKRFEADAVSFEATVNPDDDADKVVLLGNNGLVVGEETYLAVVFDPVSNTSKLYVNGKLVQTDKAPRALNKFDDVNNWLGRSQWGDPFFNGSYSEFRVWEGALTREQVADHAKGGAEQKLDATAEAPKEAAKEEKK